MSYVDKNLLPDEVIVYRAHIHWAVYIFPVFMLFLGIWSCVIDWVIGMWFTILIPIPLIFNAWIKRITSEFALTNKRVIAKIGFIRRISDELFLEKIEGIAIRQGILGRILNFGTLVINGVGSSGTPFHNISDPMEFRKRVQSQIEKMKMQKS